MPLSNYNRIRSETGMVQLEKSPIEDEKQLSIVSSCLSFLQITDTSIWNDFDLQPIISKPKQMTAKRSPDNTALPSPITNTSYLACYRSTLTSTKTHSRRALPQGKSGQVLQIEYLYQVRNERTTYCFGR